MHSYIDTLLSLTLAMNLSQNHRVNLYIEPKVEGHSKWGDGGTNFAVSLLFARHSKESITLPNRILW